MHQQVVWPHCLNYVVPVTEDQLSLTQDNVDLSGPQQETRTQRRLRRIFLDHIPELDQYSSDLVPNQKPVEFRNVPELQYAQHSYRAEKARGIGLLWRADNFEPTTSQEVIDQTERLYQQHLKNKKKLLQKFQSACGRHGGHLYWRPYTTCIFVTCKICEHAYGPVHTWE